jgi:hypothetical protein
VFEHILRNIPGNATWEGSFCERLAEHGEWNASEFWQLHLALTQAGSVARKSDSIDRELAQCVVKMYSRISGLIAAHFDANDVFKISNLGYEELHQFKERLDLAVVGVFSGEVIPESSFELMSPLIKNA